VVADVYSMEPEYWQNYGDMTCGVFAHEMGHSVFFLPDLYDYGYDSRGLGRWSLMAGGSWNGTLGSSPSHPDAWSRIQMGFATPTVLTTNLINASIPAVENTATIYRLWTNGMQINEYFLVENRQQIGYDAAMRGNGMLIYHVDESVSGNNNQWYPGYTNNGHYKVALEQADGLFHLEHYSNSGDTGDPYPGSSNNRTFDNGSTPNSQDYSFADTQVAVRNISNSGSTMTADLYVSNLIPPTIVIRRSGSDDLELLWNATGAPYYQIYSSLASDGAFTTLEGSTTANSFVDVGALSDPVKFYVVVASTVP
jgi:hypothetical protein